MAYTKEEVGSLTTVSNGLLIFSSAAEVTYPTDPAYRELTLGGNKKAYKNFIVSNGGVVSVGVPGTYNSTILSSANVYSGGVISALSGAILVNDTIHSGGAEHRVQPMR